MRASRYAGEQAKASSRHTTWTLKTLTLPAGRSRLLGMAGLGVMVGSSKQITLTQTIDREAKLAEPSSGDGEGKRERNRQPHHSSRVR